MVFVRIRLCMLCLMSVMLSLFFKVEICWLIVGWVVFSVCVVLLNEFFLVVVRNVCIWF